MPIKETFVVCLLVVFGTGSASLITQEAEGDVTWFNAETGRIERYNVRHQLPRKVSAVPFSAAVETPPEE